MKRPSRATRQARQDFVDRVRRGLLALGAVERPAGLNEFMLQTTVGTLEITIFIDGTMPWIACRFREVERAYEITGRVTSQASNPHSGKWNWHFEDQALSHSQSGDAAFLREVARLVAPDAPEREEKT